MSMEQLRARERLGPKLNIFGAAGLAATGATTFPPLGTATGAAFVDNRWNNGGQSAYWGAVIPSTLYGAPSTGSNGQSAIRKFKICLWGNSSFAVTSGELFAMRQAPLTIADDAVVSIDATTNIITLTTGGLYTGDGPIGFTGTASGFDVAAAYWVIRVGATTIQLATSLSDAWAGTAVDLTSAVEAATLVDVTSGNVTCRTHFDSYGLIGYANDGAVTITAQKGWQEVYEHDAGNIGYALSASYTGTLFGDIFPIEEFDL